MDTRMVSGGEQWNPQLRLMYRTGQGFFGILDPETLLLRTANMIADYLGTRRVGIALVTNGRLEMVASTLGAIEEIEAYLPCVLPLDDASLCGWVALRNQPLLVTDVASHPHYRAVPGFHDTVAELVLPIPSADGSVQGVIDIQSTSQERFSETARQALEALALQLGLMLDNSALNKVMQRRARATYTLERIRRQVDQHLRLEPLLNAIIEAIASFTPFDPQAVYLADHRQRFVLRAAAPDGRRQPPVHPFPSELFGKLARGTPLEWVLRDSEGPAGAPLLVPLLASSAPLGLLKLRSQGGIGGDLRLLAELGAYLGDVIERVQLFESMRLAAARQALFAQGVSAIRRSLNVLDAIDEVNHALCQGLDLDYCSLALVDEYDELHHYGVTCAPANQGRRRRIQETLEPIMAGLLGQQLWVAADLTADPRLAPPLLDALRRCEIRSVVWAPIRIEDEWLGVLCIYSFTQPRDWTDDDLRLLSDIADQVSLACRQMRLYEAERQRRRELEALQDIIGSIGGELSLSALCQKVVRKVVDVFALPAAAVVLRGTDGGLEVIASHGLAEQAVASQPLSNANVRELLRRFPPPAAMSITNLPAGSGAGRQALDGGWSLLGQPLLVDGAFSGWLQLYSDEPDRAWTPQEIHLAAAMAQQVAQAIHAARLYEKEHLLRTDAQEAYHHLREVLEELDSTREQLIRSEKLRSLGELASGVAHDFNNLLASILGNAQLLLSDERRPERTAALRVIEQAARDGAVTVRRIQEFARSSEAVYEDVVDLREVVEMALEFSRPSWRDAAQQRGAIIEIERRCESVHVLGSAAELREVVVNLIVNAADAMPHGGTIALATASEDDRALLSVADSGEGISPENRTRIFDPFFTTKPIGEGTGLGLAVALSIVQRHRGNLRVEDCEPRGAQFVAVFPRHLHSAPGSPASAPPPGTPASAQRILVVDDEPAIRKVVARVLERDGHLVALAESAEAALPLLEQEHYDIIISDLGMPGMNGWDFLELARQRHPGIGTVLLTGWGYQLDQEHSPNVDIILAKPFEMQTIRDTIAAMTATASRG